MAIERLQKFLARAGVDSRRHCEALITSGRVAVNGRPVTELGTRVDPERDRVTVDGRPVALFPVHVYLLLNKPPGYVTTASDERGRPTVMDLVSSGERRLFPVGRLDLHSEGLLLLTTDGELAQRLTHPRYGIEREYVVRLAGRPSQEGLARLRAGTAVAGRPVVPVKVVLDPRADTGDALQVRVIVGEGRKREVREIARAAGYQVLRLTRVRYGPLRLGNLAPGRSRRLRDDEVAALRKATKLGPFISKEVLANPEKASV